MDQVAEIARLVQSKPPRAARRLIAIAGPPAAGKTTIAARVAEALDAAGLPCGLVPMDGFHLDNETLDARGLRARKGAPETFDVTGFAACVARLTQDDAVSVPGFDRTKDCVVPDAHRVEARQRHVVVEGNYLLLDAPGWRELRRHWAVSIFVAPPLEELERRLIQRWLDEGLDAAAARARASENDLVNARLVLERSDLSAVDLRLGDDATAQA